ncbi:Protein spinster [Gryllus bimaculatus]|nr:Protein spinster [Gryllus bimaculatus]
MPAQKLVDKHCLRILNMEPRNIPTNNSHHQLMTGEDVDSVASTDSSYPSDPSSAAKNGRFTCLTRRQIVTVAVLCFVNLINYMDRFTIAAVLEQVKKYYGANNSSAGLLQTAFVFSYMIFAPAFGYLGDRYSRRWIMAGGVFMWSLTTLVGSYMENFHAFLFFRALVGIGEASYSTIAPTIISDLFVKNVRSRMLAIFYFAIPVGSGLGYIIGSETYKIAGQWQYALRVTPVMGVIAVLLIIFLMQDPARGESEGRTHDTTTSWFEDIRALFKNFSFMLSTLGFTCVTFVTGALRMVGSNISCSWAQIAK